MGCFSWKYSNDSRKAMKIGRYTESYLLVPEEFQDEYGEYITEKCYDGYGNMGGYDVYALVALWNRRYISEELINEVLRKPILEKYGGLWAFEKDEMKKQGFSDEEIEKKDKEEQQKNYENGIEIYNARKKRMHNFAISNKKYDARKDFEFLREVGIDLACYHNERLKYPIKITNKVLRYSEAEASKNDPNQGF